MTLSRQKNPVDISSFLAQASLLGNVSLFRTNYKPQACCSPVQPSSSPSRSAGRGSAEAQRAGKNLPWHPRTLQGTARSWEEMLCPDSAQHYSVTQHPAPGGSHLPGKRKNGRVRPWSMGLFRSQISPCMDILPFREAALHGLEGNGPRSLRLLKNLVILLQEGWCKSNHRAQAT